MKSCLKGIIQYTTVNRDIVLLSCVNIFSISFCSSEDTWLSLTGLTNIWIILEYTKALTSWLCS